MILYGLYFIKDEFFEKMNDPYLKSNKKEKRPHFYCFKEEDSEIYWMIPLSSRIEKYEKIIESKKTNKKPCDILHIVKLDNGKKSVFLIQDMLPVTEEYISDKYMIGENHMVLTSEHVINEINKKAKKINKLLRLGIKFTPTQPDVISILNKLKYDMIS